MILKKNPAEESKQESKNSLVDNLEGAFSKPKGNNRLLGDIQRAKDLDNGIGEKPKKNALEPIGHKPHQKLEPLDKKPQGNDDEFDFLGLDDLVDDSKKDEPKKNSANIEDNYDFDLDGLEFESPAPNEGSNIPPAAAKKPSNKPKDDGKEQKASINMEKFEKEKEKNEAMNKNDKDDKDEDDWLIIEGKRYREINIEGDDNEYIMDEEGNIYDLKGVYIGTAKDGGEESEEEEDK